MTRQYWLIDNTAFEADMQEVYRLLGHIKNGPQKAISRAVNYGAKTGQSFGAKMLQDLVTVTQRDLKTAMPIKRATYSDLTAKLTMEAKPIPAFEFKHSYRRKSRGGVMIQMWKDKPPAHWPHAFVAKMESGHEGIFILTGRFNQATKGRYVGMRREIIAEVGGLNMATLFMKTRGLAPSILNVSFNAAVTELARQVDYLLKLEEGSESTPPNF